MANLLYAIGCMALGAIVGSILGGYVEDVIWYAGNESLPNCEQIKVDNWRGHCYTINQTYYATKTLYQSIGAIIPLVAGLLFILKIR